MLALVVLVATAAPIPAESRQMVLSVSAGWDATRAVVQPFARSGRDAPWSPVGPAVEASLGRKGMGWGRGLHPPGLSGPQKREGDGRSPAGVFDLRLVTGYARDAPAGLRMPYRQATPTLRCVDDPRSSHYNRLADEATTPKDWSSAEDMRRQDDLYRLAVWVAHNETPVSPASGSCIFLHLRSDPESTTAGCTAIEAEPMARLLPWLDPTARPVLVQLPDGEYRERSFPWGLPEGRPRARELGLAPGAFPPGPLTP